MQKYIVFFFLFPLSYLYSQNWDINTLEKINKHDRGFVRSYSKVISRTTPYIAVGGPILFAVYAGVKKDIPLFNDAIYIGSSVAEAVILTYGLKYIVDRERPYDKYPDKIFPSSHESSSSFPSNHTASAFALATSLSIRYPKWYVIAPSAVWACSVGYARMNEGVHYPSDVITGALIGSGCAVANIYINRWLEKWLLPKPKKKIVRY